MRKKRLFWQLFPTYLLITILSLLGAVWYASSSLREFHIVNVESDLEAKARLVANQVSVVSKDLAELDRRCKTLGQESGTRITIVLPDGTVAADSEESPARMENHADRHEVKEALAGETGASTRYSDTLGKNMMYVAIPMRENGSIVGVVRTSVPLATVGEALYPVYTQIVLVTVAIGLAAVGLSLIVARRIARPIEQIKKAAERFAGGDLAAQLPIPKSEEIGSLAQTMNRMAAQLIERIRTVTQQSSEQEAILSSMIEGVLAVDRDERIIRLNRAAARMLDLTAAEVEGQFIQEAVGNPAFRALVAEALSVDAPVEGDVTAGISEEKYLHCRSAVLKDSEGKASGVVVVLNDITQLRRFESMRREFVANVSHELKTPITSVKGFVETLQDGALEVREDAQRFLGIIANELDRLNSIIEDLLLLSRVEQDMEKKDITLAETQVSDILKRALETCAMKAGEKAISIKLECDEGLVIEANALLLEHAVVNLVDNAIKYSDEGSSVEVKASGQDGGISIEVIDNGCGIEREHVPRVFERFYRVDRARSRKLGGTGLGLAIVKHIVQVHGGHVTVRSTPGEGSTFTINLPRK
jgi:two-component system phosphate regulon sensor histidine kinase PhoR